MEKLFKKLDHISDTLDTLSLGNCTTLTPSSPLLQLKFAQLRSITLCNFFIEDTAQAMEFWERHPTLEYVMIVRTIDRVGRQQPWFSRIPWVIKDFLPYLEHLKVILSPSHIVTTPY